MASKSRGKVAWHRSASLRMPACLPLAWLPEGGAVCVCVCVCVCKGVCVCAHLYVHIYAHM